jgi:hypothetical protein
MQLTTMRPSSRKTKLGFGPKKESLIMLEETVHANLHGLYILVATLARSGARKPYTRNAVCSGISDQALAKVHPAPIARYACNPTVRASRLPSCLVARWRLRAIGAVM